MDADLTTSLSSNFYPRPPRGGRRKAAAHISRSQISIHALREEGDFYPDFGRVSSCGFLSTPSARRATCPAVSPSESMMHFYPRPPRGGRLDLVADDGFIIAISIHALREEGDMLVCGFVSR